MVVWCKIPQDGAGGNRQLCASGLLLEMLDLQFTICKASSLSPLLFLQFDFLKHMCLLLSEAYLYEKYKIQYPAVRM